MHVSSSMTKLLSIVLTVFFVGILSLGISAIVPDDAFAGTWKKDSVGWWYKNDNGSYPKNAWQKIGGKWYHFDKKGYMQTGWIKTGGKWYYLNSSGAMKTGWVASGGDWVVEEGFIPDWYYMNSSGVMQVGWKKISGKWYFFDSDGRMHDGWLSYAGKDYYLQDAHHKGYGEMQTGWVSPGFTGLWYYFNNSGAMQKNKWIGNYYVQSDGTMAVNTWIGKYHVDKNGKWDATKGTNRTNAAIAFAKQYFTNYRITDKNDDTQMAYINGWEDKVRALIEPGSSARSTFDSWYNSSPIKGLGAACIVSDATILSDDGITIRVQVSWHGTQSSIKGWTKKNPNISVITATVSKNYLVDSYHIE